MDIIKYKEGKENKELKIRNEWTDITILQFIQIQDIMLSKDIDDIDRTAGLVGILLDKEVDEVLKLDIKLFNAACGYLNFLSTTPEKKLEKIYVIDGITFTLNYNMNNISTGQYLDLIHLSQQPMGEIIHKFLSLILIPSKEKKTILGKKYIQEEFGSYDVEHVAEIILNKLSIADGYSMMVFFCKLFENLTVATTHYLVKETKKLILMSKEKKLTKDLRTIVKNIPENGDGLQMLKELQTTLIEAGNKSTN